MNYITDALKTMGFNIFTIVDKEIKVQGARKMRLLTSSENKKLKELQIELEEKAKYNDALKTINDTFEAEITLLTAQYPNSEQATWELQKAQANEYITNRDKTKTPFIVALAEANSMTPLQFSRLVVAKVKAYEEQVSKALAKKQKAIKELEKVQGE